MTSASLLAAAERLEQELRDLSRYLKNFPGVSVTLNESIDTLSRLRALLGESQKRDDLLEIAATHFRTVAECDEENFPTKTDFGRFWSEWLRDVDALQPSSPSSARSQE